MPKLAEKKIWMHLVVEIMIMVMNLMTLCNTDPDNQFVDPFKDEVHIGTTNSTSHVNAGFDTKLPFLS